MSQGTAETTLLDSRLRGNDKTRGVQIGLIATHAVTVQRDAAGSLRVSLSFPFFSSPKSGGQGVDTIQESERGAK